ncbi:uncharacterized protein LOC121259671 [Juglans microcarpa x Juglans regia]|uniref:uncharacterized protein LOC121259671 n=1 Tax=Juglans microcarpa x Juglans regia TaxID=2249226 RepID=UPI001B7F3473|nr:uncharacterized protein LOC121259671 [Juglans microcarpa x Juglans regia]
MADDDDDESFGDFHFASFPNPAAHFASTIVKGTNASTSSSPSPFSWGEFITTPKHELPSGATHPIYPPNNNSFSKTDPREPDRIEPGTAQWVKPTGVLPLSIFGEFEEELTEERGFGASVIVNNKKSDSGREGSNSSVNDLITNLYSQNQQIKTQKGSSLNSNESDFSTNGSNLSINRLDSNSNGLGSDLADGNDGLDDDNDDDGWEFKVAEPEAQIGNGDSKVEPKVQESAEGARTFGFSNGVHDPGDLFVVSNGTSNSSGEWGFGFDFNSSHLTKQDGFITGLLSQSKVNDTASGMTSSEPNKKVDSVENFWEFQDAFPETGSKYKLEKPKVADTSLTGGEAQTFDGDGVVGPVDFFAVSDGISQNSSKGASGFNLNPSSMNGIILESYSKSEPNELVSSLVDENVGANENFCEFNDAFSESGLKHKSEEPKVADISPAGIEALTSNLDCVSNPEDSLVASDGISPKSAGWEFGFDFNRTSLDQDDMISGSYSKSKQNGFNSSPFAGNDESGENFGEFKDAFSETVSKREEKSKVVDYSPAGVEAPGLSGEIQRNGIRSENHREPLPINIFSDRELGSEEPSILQDVSTVTPTSNLRDGIKIPSSNVSINDLISSLYSQAEENASVNHTPIASDHGMHSSTTLFESDLITSADDFDDGSWDFKTAASGTRTEDRTSDIDLGDSQKPLSTTLELNDYVDFYNTLKDELSSVAVFHLDNLKKDQRTAVLSGEEAKAKSLDEEIQKFYNELHKDNLISKEVWSEDLSARAIHFNEFLDILLEPKFQVLESEYQMSRRLTLAEKDLKSAIELLNDVESTLAILKLGTMEEQQYYVSTWSSILSVCAHELKHGASIWKQSLQKNVRSQILSEPEGKRCILALGEIYRVVEVLGASTKVYKPWIFSTSGIATGLYGLLSECYSIWASSGLEDALKSISDRIDFQHEGTIKALLESIKFIHDIDAVALQNHVFSGQPICRLSALTAGTVPGLKLVVWNGEHYFLTLANLWANLISTDPPKLPQIHGS